MTRPRAEEPPEDQRAEHQQAHEEEPRSDDSQFERIHDFIEFQRGERLSGEFPMDDVNGKGDIDQ